jgi:iron complex outermembrane recepter protein
MQYESHSRRVRDVIVGSASLLAIGGMGQAISQNTAQSVTSKPTQSDESLLSEVVVTGTSIRGVAPVGSPVVGLGEEELSARGATTLTEAIRQLPQIFNLGTSESNFSAANNANANRTGGSGINLRGLSPEATLVLLDSRRVPPAGGGNSSYFDPSVIPSLAIERIEVMADGGSAIYGADAVGGVVNLLMRRKFNGAQINARYGLGDGIDQQVLNGLLGHSWNSGWGWLAVEFNHRSPLRAIDRDFYTDDLRPWGGPDLRPLQSNPGTIRVGTTNYAIPGGQNGQALTASQLRAGTENRESRYLLADALQEQKRYNFGGRLEQSITESITFGLEGFFSHRSGPRSTGSTVSSLTVPRSNAFFVHPTNPAAANVTVDYSFGPEFGPAKRDGIVESYWTSGSLEFNLRGDWKLLTYGSIGRNDERADIPTINTASLNRALADSNRATALNPFGAGNNTNPSTLAEIAAVMTFKTTADIVNAGFKVDGALVTVPAGEIRGAFGGDFQKQKLYSATITTGAGAPNNRTPITTEAANDRNVKSLFAEVFVPVTGAESAIGTLSLAAAGRYDRYSDFGGTTNPKLGLTWDPGHGLTVRGSFGKSFRAPVLGDINVDQQRIDVQNFADANSPTRQSRVLWIRGPNGDLKPERATTYSGGFDWEPEFKEGLKLSATYFNIAYRDRIEAPGNDTNILNRLATLSEFVTLNPPVSVSQRWLSHPAFTGTQVDPTTIVALVDGRKINSGKVDLDGLDLNGSLAFEALQGEWRIGASATKLFKFERQLSSRSSVDNILNTISNPLGFQGRAYATYTYASKITGTLYANYFGKYRNDTVTPVAQLGSWTTFDLNLRYAPPAEQGILKDVALTLDVKNVFDRDPHYVQNGTLAFDPQVADIVGRFFLFGIQKKF